MFYGSLQSEFKYLNTVLRRDIANVFKILILSTKNCIIPFS